jgi:hypothetical protein
VRLRIADFGLRIGASGLVVLDDLSLKFRNPQSPIRNVAGRGVVGW